MLFFCIFQNLYIYCVIFLVRKTLHTLLTTDRSGVYIPALKHRGLDTGEMIMEWTIYLITASATVLLAVLTGIYWSPSSKWYV